MTHQHAAAGMPAPSPAAHWYHGAPQRLCVLRAGSTVTPDRHLAQVYSHKPTLVSQEDDGTIRHNGRQPGWLHALDEPLRPGDLVPHPRTTMAPGDEWLTTRPLRLRVVGPVAVDETELLDEATLKTLRHRTGHRT